MRQCIYSIPCESGRCSIGETGRPLGVRIQEHMNNLKQGPMEKSRLAKHAYEEGHRIRGRRQRQNKYRLTSAESIRKRPTWHVSRTQLVNWAWKSLLFGFHWFGRKSAGCRAVHWKNPGLLGKVLYRVLVPALSNFIDSYRFVIAPLSPVIVVVFFCSFIFLFVFCIDRILVSTFLLTFYILCLW
jgi:hypothetical protein